MMVRTSLPPGGNSWKETHYEVTHLLLSALFKLGGHWWTGSTTLFEALSGKVQIIPK